MKGAVLLAVAVTLVGLAGGSLVWPGAAAQEGPRGPVFEKKDGRAAVPVQRRLPAVPVRAHDQGIARVVAEVARQLRRTTLRRFPGQDQLGLYLMDLDNGDATLIASDVDEQRAYCGSPSWSKDGRRILFDGSPGQEFNQTRLQMFHVTHEGVGLHSFGFGNCPTLAPDGSRVAFLLNAGAIPGARPGIYIMNSEGGERRWLAADHGIPRWSPDGKHLLIVSFSNPAKLALLDVDTAQSRAIELPGHAFRSVPSWADAGTLAAVVENGQRLEIALVDVADPASAKIKQVLWSRHEGSSAEPLYPLWSAERRRCIFVGREKQGQALYAVEPGKMPRCLEPGRYDGKIASTSLSPDGRFALFCSDRP
jgi:Tol biopolymer transport system component